MAFIVNHTFSFRPFHFPTCCSCSSHPTLLACLLLDLRSTVLLLPPPASAKEKKREQRPERTAKKREKKKKRETRIMLTAVAARVVARSYGALRTCGVAAALSTRADLLQTCTTSLHQPSRLSPGSASCTTSLAMAGAPSSLLTRTIRPLCSSPRHGYAQNFGNGGPGDSAHAHASSHVDDAALESQGMHSVSPTTGCNLHQQLLSWKQQGQQPPISSSQEHSSSQELTQVEMRVSFQSVVDGKVPCAAHLLTCSCVS